MFIGIYVYIFTFGFAFFRILSHFFDLYFFMIVNCLKRVFISLPYSFENFSLCFYSLLVDVKVRVGVLLVLINTEERRVSCRHYLWDVKPYASSWVFLFSGLFDGILLWSQFKNGPEHLTRRTAQLFIPLMRFLLCSLVLINFFVLLRYSFSNFFFHLRMFNNVCFRYSQIYIGFFFSERSDYFLIWNFCSFVFRFL